MTDIAVFAIEDALASSLALPLEMLRAAVQFRRARIRTRSGAALRVSVVAERRGPVPMSGGLVLRPDVIARQVGSATLAILPSLWRAPHASAARHPEIDACVRRLAAGGTRICSVGTGSYYLAAAGLLDERPATTHWSFFEDFAKRFPAVLLQRRHLITRSGSFYCAGSVNSIADLMVHLIAGEFGEAAARQVESQFSPEIRRPFEAHSFVEGEAGAHPDEAIWIAQDWMLAHLGDALRIPAVAARAGLSTRSFNRRFRAAIGATPHAFLQQARINAARELLRASNVAIGEIANRTGFADPSHFSRAFTALCGVSPQEYRRRVRGKLFVASGPG